MPAGGLGKIPILEIPEELCPGGGDGAPADGEGNVDGDGNDVGGTRGAGPTTYETENSYLLALQVRGLVRSNPFVPFQHG